MATDKMPVPTESAEQQALFRWARASSGKHPELRLMYHIPNEGKRNPATGRRMRAEGLRRGVPDICAPIPRGVYHGLYIEMKRRKHSKVTDDQKEWIAALREQGYAACVCYGWEEAAQTIEKYLGGGEVW